MPLATTLAAIRPLDRSPAAAVQAHLDDLTKPPGSLGRLEEIALQCCLIAGDPGYRCERRRIVTFAGDHGIADQGVSAFPKAVTPQMVRNMLAGGAAVNVLAGQAGAEVQVVDIGVDDDLAGAPAHLVRAKVRRGTADFSQGPAMTRDEAVRAIEVGIGLAHRAADEGVRLLGTGEMGIANTSPSSALFAALLPCPVAAVTGRGTGIDDARLIHKTQVLERALDRHRAALADPLSALAAVGGLEIAGIAGLLLGAAERRIPAIVDGFISSAGALVACRLCPALRDHLLFSHLSAEAGHRRFCELFQVRPLLDLDLRLGEGSGAAVAMHLVVDAMAVYHGMATFSAARVSGKSPA